MEQKFAAAWMKQRQEAQELGIRLRPLESEKAMEQAHRELSGHRLSDGFSQLMAIHRLDLTLEALSVKKQFTALFNDEEANHALMRLLDAGYGF